MSESATIPAPVAHLNTVLIELKRLIFGVGHQVGVERAVLALLCTRLDRLRHRLTRLLTRPTPPAAPSPIANPSRTTQPNSPAPAAPNPTIKLPSGKQWLLKLLPHFLINSARGHVVHFIHHPETIASAAQTPQLAAQVFRPLCRFFSIPMPLYLQLPPRPRKPRKPRPARKPKPIKPPKPPEPTFLDYLLAKYPPTDNFVPATSQIRKIFSR